MSNLRDNQTDTGSLLVTKVQCILIDIEGTTSAIQFVYDVLFPYARNQLNSFLKRNWKNQDVQDSITYLAKDLGFENLSQWSQANDRSSKKALEVDHNSVGDSDRASDKLLEEHQKQLVENEAVRLMDADIKSTGLKALQGLIWAEGYAEGTLTSHVFPDVPGALESWNKAQIDIRIFSSGSVNAQKVFFKNTEYGDLGKFISNNYDTTTGAKREPQSYKSIAEDIGLEPEQILFLSDVEPELDAAKQAGMKVALVVRPGNAPADLDKFPVIESFEQIIVTR
ncbi:MAG TPA: acireductone synthase [Drouetiella sp.]